MVKNINNNEEFKTACQLWITNEPQALALYDHISDWDTSAVTDMTEAFDGATNFNEDLSKWNTSNVTSMRKMFNGCTNFNSNINNWDTSKVEDMSLMFSNCSNFNQDLHKWDTSSVTLMTRMFYNCSEFNGNINSSIIGVSVGTITNQYLSWDTSNVTDMREMFANALNFNNSVSDWNTSEVTNMRGMFRGCISFDSDLSTKYITPYLKNSSYYTHLAWDISRVTIIEGMLQNCEKFNNGSSGPLQWKLNSNLVSLKHLFSNINPGVYNQVNDTLNVKLVNSLTGDIYSYTSWDLSNVQRIDFMFRNQASFNQELNNWNTSNVTSMLSAFEGCEDFNKSLDKWDVSKLTVSNTVDIFKNATTLNRRNFPGTMPPALWLNFWGLSYSVRFENNSAFYKTSGQRITNSFLKPVCVFNDGSPVTDVSDVRTIENFNVFKMRSNREIHHYISENVKDLKFRFLYWEVIRKLGDKAIRTKLDENGNETYQQIRHLELIQVNVYERSITDDFNLRIQYNEKELNSVGMFSDYQENILTSKISKEVVSQEEVLDNFVANNIGLDISDIHPKLNNSSVENCLITSKDNNTDEPQLKNIVWNNVSFKGTKFGHKHTVLSEYLTTGYWRVPYEMDGYRAMGPANSYFPSVRTKAYEEYNNKTEFNFFTNRFQFDSRMGFKFHAGSSGVIMGNKYNIENSFSNAKKPTYVLNNVNFGEFKNNNLWLNFKTEDFDDTYSIRTYEQNSDIAYETIKFDSKGFLGFYFHDQLGNSDGKGQTYEILGRSNDGLYLRTVATVNADGDKIAYYVRLVRDKEINVDVTEVGFVNSEFGDSGVVKRAPDWFEVTNKGDTTVSTEKWYYDNKNDLDSTNPRGKFSNLLLKSNESAVFIVGWEEYYDSAEEAIEVFLLNWSRSVENLKIGFISNGASLSPNDQNGGEDSIFIFIGNLKIASVLSYLKYTAGDDTQTIDELDDLNYIKYASLGGVEGTPGNPMNQDEINQITESSYNSATIVNKRYKYMDENRPTFNTNTNRWEVKNDYVLAIASPDNFTLLNENKVSTGDYERTFNRYELEQAGKLKKLDVKLATAGTDSEVDNEYKKFKWNIGDVIETSTLFSTNTTIDLVKRVFLLIAKHNMSVFEFDHDKEIIYVKESYGREHFSVDFDPQQVDNTKSYQLGQGLKENDVDRTSEGIYRLKEDIKTQWKKLPVGSFSTNSVDNEINPSLIRRLNNEISIRISDSESIEGDGTDDLPDLTNFQNLPDFYKIQPAQFDGSEGKYKQGWTIHYLTDRENQVFVDMYKPTLFVSELFMNTQAQLSGAQINNYIEIYNPTNYNISLDYFYGFPNWNSDDKTLGAHEFWNMFPKKFSNKIKRYICYCSPRCP